ncbi:MAG TPA: hypothetical protein VMZ53_24695 [Kofleriaceae bacterium]|nr:hypothetical protein [Kofleriaceae bacterium]
MRARSIEHDIVLLPRWDADLNEKGERAELASTLLFAAGGAAVVGGVVMIVLRYRAPEDATKTSLHVVPRADGASVWWSGAF